MPINVVYHISLYRPLGQHYVITVLRVIWCRGARYLCALKARVISGHGFDKGRQPRRVCHLYLVEIKIKEVWWTWRPCRIIKRRNALMYENYMTLQLHFSCWLYFFFTSRRRLWMLLIHTFFQRISHKKNSLCTAFDFTGIKIWSRTSIYGSHESFSHAGIKRET